MQNQKTIVIGGGILGKATAFSLAQAGFKVTCIYQRTFTHGQASLAAGGMLGIFSEINAHDPVPRRRLEVEQRWLSRQLYTSWIDELCAFTGLPILLQNGLFVVGNAVGREDRTELAAIREAVEWCGSRADTVSPLEIPGLVPDKAPFDAVFLPEEGSVDTAQLLTALDYALAQQPNVTVIDERAEAVLLSADSTVIVQTSQTLVQGEAVILAGGAEIPRLLAASSLLDLGIPPIFSGRGVSMLVKAGIHLPYTIRTPNDSALITEAREALRN